MRKAIDYAKRVKGTHATMESFRAAMSSLMRADGVPHAPAQRDDEGRCLTCGAKVICPGVHTFEEIQHANRLQVRASRAKMEPTTTEKKA